MLSDNWIERLLNNPVDVVKECLTQSYANLSANLTGLCTEKTKPKTIHYQHCTLTPAKRQRVNLQISLHAKTTLNPALRTTASSNVFVHGKASQFSRSKQMDV